MLHYKWEILMIEHVVEYRGYK